MTSIETGTYFPRQDGRAQDVRFRPLWRYVAEKSTQDHPVWEKVNEITRVRR